MGTPLSFAGLKHKACHEKHVRYNTMIFMKNPFLPLARRRKTDSSRRAKREFLPTAFGAACRQKIRSGKDIFSLRTRAFYA